MSFEKIKSYCNSLTKYGRLVTREVSIGDIPLGGKNPIRIQSMTTTDTMNTIATVEQSIRMINAGCEYVRITAPSLKEAENLRNIKDELRRRGYNAPLIADIHFTPNAAELAARIVEKVRVNPGNYVDKKKFQTIEYTDAEYHEELERIRERFTPLVKICKEYGTAMRIGTNHGSLSDRIMSRYGDTPLGMVESALEFLRICEDENYHSIVLSMKASNTQVMVQAYRLLIAKMHEEGMNYPLHLGVTEAGDGEDGRIKSAVGIGTLLEDGIGDTIRVSLTEEPEFESPVAISLASRYANREMHKPITEVDESPKNPFNYERRKSFEVAGIGGTTVPKVFADFSSTAIQKYDELKEIGYSYDAVTDKWNIADTACDFLFLGSNDLPFDAPTNLKLVYTFEKWNSFENKMKGFPYFNLLESYINSPAKSFVLNFVELNSLSTFSSQLSTIANDKTVVLVITTNNLHGMADQRRIFFELIKQQIKNPVVLKRSYSNQEEETRLYASTDLGALLLDGFGDGVWLESNLSKNFINRTLFGILQACRTRISKTEYISCPSCGRTLFDLVEVTNKIRKRTEHLKGVKIAVMGCIVNGPGEMADADYGYVGSGVGKITLYRGKEVLKRNIGSENALDELIGLIKEDGNWVEAPKI
ncbi:MAG: 4-hydroxy-3-methylbut-2-en-1-yl diphosphate synthase [Stygiobacter sp. RIFOXYC12_FULL_38_8]|nr:MAG: 4-hydroxy-3-methylbut-2-en-1-yl diphosphate synthase [Stygiobacter sp. GWC2_38_9]OGU83116.1 MAG: 4-hydroxy-3-methylbut-2-en-1-yl diphosphate synthase [Stygiobacter sp. RIFOXYA12_FULL_38_9]OGV07108.1 MAG: 4-hydroxy-3-methylbut-2-en-1-yl diphosphate synthase [Stygiobacter sp. RIFOXYB2_FULL_37_11]OGV12044.1 MAG: 4-hydroxy-3-methylbut-2-en-1-yl diphosphate synthase [Stygiobacter sp. RIFOXYA2_FULL_38_8]OGV12375.1 MAG: 4-hydroxy-3-methylbut-2-en-1-yl diphosphate synthase [Stygiobacter sp. RIF